MMKTGLVRWKKSTMPITVHIERFSEAAGFRPEYADILQTAWLDWSKASSGRVRIKFVPYPYRARVVCKWTDKRDPEPGLPLGHAGVTSIRHSDGNMIQANMRIRTDILQEAPRSMAPDLAYRTALHEVGHALGLLGHSDQPSDIMFGFCLPEDTAGALSMRDINTLIALYTLERSEIAKHKRKAFAHSESPLDPESKAMILSNEAVVAAQDGNHALVIAKLEEARMLAPSNKHVQRDLEVAYFNYPTSLCNEATADLRDGNYDLAIAKVEKACKISREIAPSNKSVKRNLGVAYLNCFIIALKTANWSAAAGCFTKAILLLGKR